MTTTEINTQYLPAYLLDSDGNVIAGKEEDAKRISQGVAEMLAELPQEEQDVILLMLSFDLFVDDPEALFADQTTMEKTLQAMAAAAIAIVDIIESMELDVRAVLDAVMEALMSQQEDDFAMREKAREEARDLNMLQAKKMIKSARKELRAALGSLITAVVALTITVVSTAIAVNSMSNQSKAVSEANKAEAQLANTNQKLADPTTSVSERATLQTQQSKLSMDIREKQAVASQAGQTAESQRMMGKSGSDLASSSGGYYQAELQADAKIESANATKKSAEASHESGTAELFGTSRTSMAKAVELAMEVLKTIDQQDAQSLRIPG